MPSTSVVVLVSLTYLAALFLIAHLADRVKRGFFARLLNSPITYTLSIAVYCTSWTFYGAVGTAAGSGLAYTAIYLGPTLVFIGWWFLLRKMVTISRQQRITSIADFLSSRYGKSAGIAALVTVIAIFSLTPYIALQLRAIAGSFSVITPSSGLGRIWPLSDTGLVVAGILAAFTILFGTRHLTADERHQGIVAAIAVESLVKLIALGAVGMFVVFSLWGGPGAMFAAIAENPDMQKIASLENVRADRWITLLFLSGVAVLCLPRQFQVTVVENQQTGHLRTASWLFPLYLLLISLFVVPIAVSGLAFSSTDAGADADFFVLTVPLEQGQGALALLAFVGGLSSATSMVIVSTLVLAIMISNHLVMPLLLRFNMLSSPQTTGGGSGPGNTLRGPLLLIRRVSVLVTISLGYIYYSFSPDNGKLASIGLIAFVGVAQFLPALLGGLFWKGGTRFGAQMGLSLGFLVWLFLLVVPSIDIGGPWAALSGSVRTLLNTFEQDPLAVVTLLSLALNTLAFIIGSIVSRLGPLDQLQAAAFVDVFRNPNPQASLTWRRSVPIEELRDLSQRFLGRRETSTLFGDALPQDERALSNLVSRVEAELASTIGSASARLLVSRTGQGDNLSAADVYRILDEASQIREYSRELETRTGELRAANAKLQALDTMKDLFLSQVSHELRTPMTSVRSFSEILAEETDLPEYQRRRFAEIISQETDRLTQLLDNILHLNRLESQDEATARKSNAIMAGNAPVRRGLTLMQPLADQHGVSLDIALEDTEAAIFGDSDSLEQVVINLLSNAIKFADENQPRCEVRTFVRDATFYVEIADNGPGLSPDFFSARSSQTVQAVDHTSRGRWLGNGLGLTISRRILSTHSGTLIIANTGKPGTCIRAGLPLRIASENSFGERSG